MKLTNNRFYFDFNATSPLAQSVKDWLAIGDFSFANASSVHSSGKAARRDIQKSRDFLFQTFGLKETEHRLYFHSGASEAINQIIKGHAQKWHTQGEPLHFFYANVDHSCIVNQVPYLKAQGHKVYALDVDGQGDLLWDKAIEEINQVEGPVLVNLTWVNNETGVVWDLDKIRTLKEKTNAYIHVDAVQSVGKVENWTQLAHEIDAYTFSGHKFGALKGVGMSFLKVDFPFESLIVGGGQQENLRAGTHNTMGIVSLRLALEELIEHQDIKSLRKARDELQTGLEDLIKDQGEIIAKNAIQRNASTLCFCLNNSRADILATAFDLAGMDVSTGSACSSGAVNPSRVLLAMGRNEEMAKSVLRLSFSPYFQHSEVEEFSQKISSVIQRFL